MMKELGFEFDDDIFGESSCKESKVEEAYKPKQCDPEVCLYKGVKDCLLEFIEPTIYLKLVCIKLTKFYL